MKMSDTGQQYLSVWEGIESKVYTDVAGLPTIGVGHLLTRSERASGKIYIDGVPVKYDTEDGLSLTEIYSLLEQDLERFEEAVESSVVVFLNQHQFDALVSFTFNVGVTAFKKSTLLKRLNYSANGYEQVPPQLRRWVYSAGKVIRGLQNRRESEIRMWQGKLVKAPT